MIPSYLSLHQPESCKIFLPFFLSFCLDRLSFVLIHKDTPAQTEGKKKMKAQKAERVFIFNM